MKKLLAIILAGVLCISATACVADKPTEPETEEQSVQESVSTYTYTAESMQNADCVYYEKDAYVPNSPNPDRVRGKIAVWTQCPNCGNDNINYFIVDPETLNFSSGDTVLHNGTDSCWDCSEDRGIEQFMWTIRVTRIPE